MGLIEDRQRVRFHEIRVSAYDGHDKQLTEARQQAIDRMYSKYRNESRYGALRTAGAFAWFLLKLSFWCAFALAVLFGTWNVWLARHTGRP